MAKARIDQVIGAFSPLDASGHQMLVIQAQLRARGYESGLFACEIKAGAEGQCAPLERYLASPPHDAVLINHCAAGHSSALALIGLPAFLVSYFHNCTPPEFYTSIASVDRARAMWRGYRQLHLLRALTGCWWAVSRFNASVLARVGCPAAEILPIGHDGTALRGEAEEPGFGERFHGRRTLLFVGRLAPNKAQHDLVGLAYLLKRHHPEPVRLVLAGWDTDPTYLNAVQGMARALGLSVATGLEPAAFAADVIVTGPVAPRRLASLYRHADVFVCASDHEGFCVPVVEAMTFGVPVVAHAAEGVAETCGDGALLVDKRSPATLFRATASVLTDATLRYDLAGRGRERARAFGAPAFEAALDRCLDATYALKGSID